MLMLEYLLICTCAGKKIKHTNSVLLVNKRKFLQFDPSSTHSHHSSSSGFCCYASPTFTSTDYSCCEGQNILWRKTTVTTRELSSELYSQAHLAVATRQSFLLVFNNFLTYFGQLSDGFLLHLANQNARTVKGRSVNCRKANI